MTGICCKAAFVFGAVMFFALRFVCLRPGQSWVFALGLSLAFALIVGLYHFFFIFRPLALISRRAREIIAAGFSGSLSFSSPGGFVDIVCPWRKELAAVFNEAQRQARLLIEDAVGKNSRMEAVLLSMVEGVMVVDKDGRVALMNSSLRSILSVADPIGKSPIEVARNIEIKDFIQSVLKGERAMVAREVSIFSPGERIFSLHAAPVTISGRARGAVFVFHDISELKRLERVRRDFVANVSHELRTPLSSIKGYAETLLDGAWEDKGNARDFLAIIHKEAGHLARLIDEILDLSRIEAGKTGIDLKSCDIQALIKGAVSRLETRARDKQVSLVLKIATGLSLALADEVRITQVLVNIVDNAIKYNRRGGSVVIAAQEENGFVRVDVCDTGIGISAQDIPRVFERFYRVDKSRSRQMGGTGLGLSIVKHIIQAHQGRVSCRSRLGQGSVFSFTLPLLQH